MRHQLFLAFLLIASLAACQQEQSGERRVTEDGVEYTVHTNTGGEQPQPGQFVKFHAQMRAQDSVVVSSRQQSAETPIMRIPAETPDTSSPQQPNPIGAVLKQMGIGDSATLLIDLDTMQQKPAGFENESTMYYDLVLLEILSQEDYQAERQAKMEEMRKQMESARAREAEVAEQVTDIAAQYRAGELGDQLQETDSGLKYMILEEGEGKPINPGDFAMVHYYGALTNGEAFDNSYQRGQPINVPVGQQRVIPGWDEGLALMRGGDKGVLIVPPELGYGEQGSPPNIPPNSELIFYLEIQDAQ